jgi:subtilisin family serine protease
MTDFRDLSRLPDDPAYWAELEARMLAATGDVGAATGAVRPWWSTLGQRAGTLVGLAAAAGIATLLLVPARPAVEAVPAVTMLGSAIADPTLARFVAAPAPPAIANLLVDPSREDSQ